MEYWKDIDGYVGSYQVSSLGRVRSLDRFVYGCGKHKTFFRRGVILKGRGKKGYLSVRLSGKNFTIHRLVAQAFIPNTYNKPLINHINLCKFDNRVENLEWCTHVENMNHARDLGVFIENQVRGEVVKIGKLTSEYVRDIRDNFNVSEGRGNVYYSKKYLVSIPAIRAVRKRRTWNHIP